MVQTIAVTFRARVPLVKVIDDLIAGTGFYTGRADFVAYCARRYYSILLESYVFDFRDKEQQEPHYKKIREFIAINESEYRTYREGSFRPINVKIPEGQYFAIIGLGIETNAYDNIQTFLRAAVAYNLQMFQAIEHNATMYLKKVANDFKR